MTHTAIYDEILADLAGGEMDSLQRAIFDALRRAYPSGLTRRQLIFEAYGVRVADGDDLNNNGRDRKIRAAIADLVGRGMPIVSNSGGAGYALNINEGDIEATLAEMCSRRKREEERIRATELLLTKIRHQKRILSAETDLIPHELSSASRASQPSLFGEG